VCAGAYVDHSVGDCGRRCELGSGLDAPQSAPSVSIERTQVPVCGPGVGHVVRYCGRGVGQADMNEPVLA
jgi:hypothetical protein